MANLRSIVVGPPYAGLDTASGPGGGAGGTCPLHRNWLPNYPAKAKARGPIGAALKDETTFQKTWPLIIFGAIEHDDTLIVSYVKKNATNYNISPWQAPHVKSPAPNRLMEPEIFAHKVNIKSSTVEELGSFEQAKAPYLQGERLGRNTFFLSASGVAGPGNNPPPGIEVRGHWVMNSEIRYYNGSTIGELGQLRVLGAKYIKAHLERLWAFGGSSPTNTKEVTAATATGLLGTLKLTEVAIWEALEVGSKVLSAAGAPSLVGQTVTSIGDPILNGTKWEYPIQMSGSTSSGETPTNYTSVKFENPGWTRGTKQYPNALWYSAQEGPFGTNAWTSPTSGLVNKIVVGNEENDYLVAGAVVNQNLVIFKRHSIWYLTGYSPETFVLRKLTGDRGCVDPWSVCEANGGVYFCSQNGFEFFDGTEFHTIDSQVNNSVRTRMLYLTTKGDNGEEVTKPSRVQITYFGNGYLFISMQEFNVTTLAPVQVDNYLFHIQSGNWTQVTTNATFTDVITFVGYSAGLPWLYDGKYFRNCSYLTNPDAEQNQVFWELDPENANAKTPIPSEYETDRIELSGNGGYTSQLHRFLLDYSAHRNTGSDATAEAATKPLKVTITGDNGAVINENATPYELPAQGSPALSQFTEGRRFENDTFTEAVAGVKLKVQTVGVPNEGTLTEIYDAIFELQSARQRRRV